MIQYLYTRFHVSSNIGSMIIVSMIFIVLSIGTFLLSHTVFFQLKHFIQRMPSYQELMRHSISNIGTHVDQYFGLSNGTSLMVFEDQWNHVYKMYLNPVEREYSFNMWNVIKIMIGIGWNIVVTFLSALLLLKDFDYYKNEFKRFSIYREVHMVNQVLSELGVAYLKAQFILMCITAVICSIGLFLIGNQYAIVFGVGVAIFDAFPILGSALVLIPWSIILLIKKQYMHAFVLFVTYILCQTIRQILEPKIVGDRIGVKPFYTLVAMYIGIRVYGAFGFILGPLSLVTIRAIVQVGIEKLRGTIE